MHGMLVVAALVSSSSLAQQPPPLPPPLPLPSATTATECFPSCRTGYLCHQGQCVSRCNPPCGEGLVCLDSGECALGPTSPAPRYVSQTADVGMRVSAGWARGAGIYGIVTMAMTAVLTTTVAALNGNGDAATYVGAIATVFAAVSIPLIAVGAGSARGSGLVAGLSGARIAGWILYGLTMANAVVAVALGLAGWYVPTPAIISLGVLGVASALFFTLDAFASASQANELRARSQLGAAGLQHAPFVSILPPAPGARSVGLVGGWSVAL